MLVLECGDVLFSKPDRHYDRERHAVIDAHEALQCFVPQLVVADGGNDEAGRFGRCVSF